MPVGKYNLTMGKDYNEYKLVKNKPKKSIYYLRALQEELKVNHASLMPSCDYHITYYDYDWTQIFKDVE